MLGALALADTVDAVVSAEDVARGKPEPDVFLAAAARLGVPSSRCIVVEDAAAGIEAARRAGMRTVGVGVDRVLAADVSVRSLADLADDTFDRLITSGAGVRSSS
jgi:beta-phosphoglucomutase-like phosphatase (HAD superfamily)